MLMVSGSFSGASEICAPWHHRTSNGDRGPPQQPGCYVQKILAGQCNLQDIVPSHNARFSGYCCYISNLSELGEENLQLHLSDVNENPMKCNTGLPGTHVLCLELYWFSLLPRHLLAGCLS